MIPKLSVLVPVYNAAPYLKMALDSIVDQSFSDFELLIIDDGSSDSSLEIARGYEVDARVKVRSRENRGLVETRNELIDWAQSEWIVWMDADDISKEDRLQAQYDFIFNNSENYVCVGTFAQCIDPLGNNLNIEKYPKSHREIVELQMLGGGIRFATTIMRKSVAIDVGGFRGGFRMGEDLDLLIRMGERGKLANIDTIFYFYRQHLKSTVSTFGSNWVACRSLIVSLARERQECGSDRLQRGEAVVLKWADPRMSSLACSEIYYRWSSHSYNNGNYRISIRYSLLSLIRYPLRRHAWIIFTSSLFMLVFKRV